MKESTVALGVEQAIFEWVNGPGIDTRTFIDIPHSSRSIRPASVALGLKAATSQHLRVWLSVETHIFPSSAAFSPVSTSMACTEAQAATVTVGSDRGNALGSTP